MPFTTTQNVRNHLQEFVTLRDRYADVAVEMSGLAANALMHTHLKEASVVVKGKELSSPRATLVTIDSTPVALGWTNVIPDSVVVASNSSLGCIYTEHVDYHIEYKLGTIERLPEGGIPAGATVAVWFFAYRIYQSGSDYSVDHVRGTIRRLSSGQIENNQTVFVDYETQTLTLDEEQINNAIIEADDLLLSLIDPGYRERSDQSLTTAETYLALAIVCRIKALGALQQSGGAGIAANWQALGRSYESDGLKIAARFAAQRGRLNTPMQVTGGDA
ncbi:MAG: hypothetical protein WBP29_03020 [Candidatus Zixiibacteriota bacterium]